MKQYYNVSNSKMPNTNNDSKNEVKITNKGLVRGYLTYSAKLLSGEYDEIVLRAMGLATSKAVTIAELLKLRLPGLHQITKIESTTITDKLEPRYEGFEPREVTRNISVISITLSKSIKPGQEKTVGYQAPATAEEIADLTKSIRKTKGGRPRGRGRGMTRGNVQSGRRGVRNLKKGKPKNSEEGNPENSQPEKQENPEKKDSVPKDNETKSKENKPNPKDNNKPNAKENNKSKPKPKGNKPKTSNGKSNNNVGKEKAVQQ